MISCLVYSLTAITRSAHQAGTAELEVVYLPVYPMIVLWCMDEDEVVNGDDVFASLAASLHLSLLGSSNVERKLVAQAMEDVDAILLYLW